MAKRGKKKHKRKTLGKMTQTRGTMPPPTVKDEDKRRKNKRKEVKRKLRSGDYEV